MMKHMVWQVWGVFFAASMVAAVSLGTPTPGVTVTGDADRMVVVTFDTPVTTSHLKLVQPPNDSFLLFHAIPLQEASVPPAQGSLLLLR